MRIHSIESKELLTPEQSLVYLKEGNLRFASNLRINRDLLRMVDQYADQQYPFAAILGCSDSRVPVELVFDQGLGDLFVVRVAGNIASINAIASLEFACKILGSKIIVVLGHSECGAVKAACDGAKLGNLTALLSHIDPALNKETEITDNRNSGNKLFVHKITMHNIDHQIETILSQSDIIRDLYHERQVDIVGAVYDIKTGVVTFREVEKEKHRSGNGVLHQRI